jgi:hypothetical protein
MWQVLPLILHFIAGLMSGSLFGAKTLVVLALAMLVEGVVSLFLNGPSMGLVWLLTGQAALQAGYLGGVFLRSALDRAGIILAPQPSRRP